MNRILGLHPLQQSARNYFASLIVALVVCGFVGEQNLLADEQLAADREQLEFFENKVRPLLADHCYQCHSAKSDRVEGGLLLDSRAAHLQGGDSGAAIVVGDADASLLVESVRYESYEMPPKGQLPDSDIETLVKWVNMGAPWPKEAAPTGVANVEKFDLEKRKTQHWVWQPITRPAVPKVSEQDWPIAELDHFVLNRLEKAGLQPVEKADDLALLRRLYFDITGLPPTVDQIREFANDPSAHAIEKVVDSLLQSPHFGERWGRHWLDLVRYAESRGHEFDHDAMNAYQYRDYIIRAFNEDVPYDQLVREHIAGDLVETPRLNAQEKFNESVLGTGFWHLGEWAHSPVDILKDESDRFDNMVDVFSKTFLGVTVSCARCHDHKFDAISTADYYSLTGYLQSSDYRQVRFETIEHNRAIAKQLWGVDHDFRNKVKQLIVDHGLEIPAASDPISHSGVVVDFGRLSSEDFMQNGFVFGDAPQQAGDPTMGQDGKLRFSQRSGVVNDLFWNELVSISQPNVNQIGKLEPLPSSGRTLRSPTFELLDGKVSVLVHGKGHIVACVDSHRMVKGPLHGQTLVEIGEDRWTTLKLKRYIGHRLHLEFVPAEGQQLSVGMIVQGVSDDRLAEVDRELLESEHRFEAYAAKLSDPGGVSQDLATALGSIAEAWHSERQRLHGQVRFESRLAPAMFDGTGEDAQVYVRGNSSKPGKTEPRHFLTAIAGDRPMEISKGSGRLQLAEAVNSSKNPLTSRVIVNRIWHYMLGRGIVPTTDDFGVLGQSPSHPLLLDHLASKFAEDGHSIKQMIRYVALSRTYQMASRSDDAAVEADPKNLLWHHRPPKRLEGEAIRDSLLLLSGRLDPTLFGPPVPIHLTSFMGGRGAPQTQGSIDGDGRRSIYISIRRNFLSAFMATFDTPAPFSSMGRRNVSNVPAQALTLMNDPFVAQQAAAWAMRACDVSEDPSERVVWLYESAFARKPTSRELQIAKAFIGDPSDSSRWKDYAHGLINTKEFIFVR